MKTIVTKILPVLFFLCSATSVLAQGNSDWEPTGTWPFLNKQFRTATVYTGVFNRTKTVVPCNIHVGNQTLWYSQNDTLMEAIPGTIIRVEFPNGDVYMPVGSNNELGRIVREDTIGGRVARVVWAQVLNRKALDQRYLDYWNKSQNLLQGSSFSGFAALADVEGGRILEEEPLPLMNVFYFQVNGEIFQATSKNILAHINPKRKQEYRNFTRSAEIISTNESSILKIWKEFFLKWNKDGAVGTKRQ
ncbi:MAG: hypothetical protein J5924_02475 [Bacteroidaceae bacterium]|jgi:hypothetical protein|nr:hypothetical protein [Bacteroidaceae bacterium]